MALHNHSTKQTIPFVHQDLPALPVHPTAQTNRISLDDPKTQSLHSSFVKCFSLVYPEYFWVQLLQKESLHLDACSQSILQNELDWIFVWTVSIPSLGSHPHKARQFYSHTLDILEPSKTMRTNNFQTEPLNPLRLWNEMLLPRPTVDQTFPHPQAMLLFFQCLLLFQTTQIVWVNCDLQ